MAIWRKDKGTNAGSPKAVLAAAMPMSGPDVRRVATMRNQQTVEGWQTEAWYFYDAVGELRAPINWIANAVSQAMPFAAETDPETGTITGPTDDPRVQKAATLLLGGAAQRAQLQYLLAVCWQVPGEAWVVIRPTAAKQGVAQPDQWLVLSGQKVTAKGGSWQYIDPATLLPVQLGPRDRLIRVWSPHPNDQAKADTSVRPALPILREIEKSSMNIAARLDSRLAGNGILAFPQEINFPTADGVSQASSVTSYLMEAMEASLANPGTAASQVPIVLEMPSELVEAFKNGHLDLSTDFDASVVDLRSSGLDRLAATLDMPKEVAAGTTGESNHWSAWQVEESTYKIYIEPLLQRLGDALTEYWLHPALKAMGIENAESYVVDWDTSEIVSRPDATDDLNWLYDHDLISDQYRRTESGIPDDAIPDEQELQLRRLIEAVRVAPTLAADPQIAQALFGFEVAPAAAGVADTAIEADPGSGTAPAEPRALPATQDAAQQNDVALAAAASLIAFDAFSRAGGRLLTREYRGQFASVLKHELHTHIPFAVTTVELDRLTEGSFQFTDAVADAHGYDRSEFNGRIREYVTMQLHGGYPHDQAKMMRYIKSAGKAGAQG
jgi:hypothetical protein